MSLNDIVKSNLKEDSSAPGNIGAPMLASTNAAVLNRYLEKVHVWLCGAIETMERNRQEVKMR